MRALRELLQEQPELWHRLVGCNVLHSRFCIGTITEVLIPEDGESPYLMVVFAQATAPGRYLANRMLTGFHLDLDWSTVPDDLTVLVRRKEEARMAELRREEATRERRARAAEIEQARRLEQQRAAEASEQARALALVQRAERGEGLREAEIDTLIADRRDAALHAYLNAYFRRTGDHIPLLHASSEWRQQRRPAEAEKATQAVLRRAVDLQLGPRAVSAIYTTRGGALRDLGFLEEAEHIARLAIEYDPASPQPHTLLGVVLMQQGQPEDAQDHFDLARQLGGGRGG